MTKGTGIININYLSIKRPYSTFEGYRFSKMLKGKTYRSKYTKDLAAVIKIKEEFYKKHNLKMK